MLLLNTTRHLFKIWHGDVLPATEDGEDMPYVLGEDEWENIGFAMRQSRTDIPRAIAHTPRDISKHWKGFTAREWESWLLFYGVLLLQGRMLERYVDNFKFLAQAYEIT